MSALSVVTFLLMFAIFSEISEPEKCATAEIILNISRVINDDAIRQIIRLHDVHTVARTVTEVLPLVYDELT